jgi:predicted kinase
MKELRILRGLPGSGKSRLAKKIASEEQAVVYNNDDLLTVHGVYKWDEDRALLAHWTTQQLVADSMRQDVPLIVLDNTNLLPYHASPYVRLAKYYGYHFSVIEMETPWCQDIAELERRNAHFVPRSVLEEMKGTMTALPKEALETILLCEIAMDPEVSLRMAQTFIEEGRYIQADEQMIDYENWRWIGGYEPEAGTEVAASINDKLQEWRASCT